MIVYVVVVSNQIDPLFEEFYVKCVESSVEKAKEKIKILMGRFLKSHNLTWDAVKDYGDMLIATIDGNCYTVSYEANSVSLEKG